MVLTSSGGLNIERDQDSLTIQEMGLAAGSLYSSIIFDGDDTLWRTMPLYTAAKRRFFALLLEVLVLTKNAWRKSSRSGISRTFRHGDLP
jgi:hypothetical protein